MENTRLPPALALTVALVFLAGGAFLAYLAAEPWNLSLVLQTLLLALLVLVAGLFPFPVAPKIQAGVTTAPIFMAVLALPPGPAVVASVAGVVIYQLTIRFRSPDLRLPWFKYPFNAGETVLSAGAASWVFHSLGGNFFSVAPLASMLAMFLLNTGLVSLAAGVHQRENVARLWWKGMRLGGLGEVALYSFGYVGALAYVQNPGATLAVLVPVVVIYIAFSRLSRMNERLENALEELRRLQGQVLQQAKLATLGALSLDLAHQLKNPLFILIGRLESIQRRVARNDPLYKRVQDALQAAWRMNELAEVFLGMGRQRRIRFNLLTSLEEAIAMSSTRMSHVTAIERLLPDEPVTVSGNPILLREALSNLVNNALEAVPQQGGRVTVEVKREEGQVVITIADNGPGIPQSQLERLFEPFRSTKKNGLGLGLFSARHIVELHGGSLKVFSKPGEGTTVQVTLPEESPQEESSDTLTRARFE